MDFREIQRQMDNSVAEHQVPVSDIAVSYKGEIVYRYRNGYIDDEKSVPVKGDELYFLYSATKPITCTAALQLYEKGKIRLEDKLSDYIPEFRDMWMKTDEGLKKTERPITLKHLFTMTSGLDYNLTSQSIKEQLAAKPYSSTLEMVKAIARKPVHFEPGDHFLYSLSHDVLAAVVELVSDMSFGEYLKKHIFEVCGMERTGFILNDEIRSQMCSQYIYDPKSGLGKLTTKTNPYILTPAYESGGAGLISCVDDYIKFVTEMANGNRLLKAQTIDLMRTNHLGEQAYEDFQSHKKGYFYGLGVRTDYAGRFAAKGEFGWDGAAGAYLLVDPKNKLSIFFATHLFGWTRVLKHGHCDLRNLVYEILQGE